jgi:hypothetical protein
LSEGKRKRGMKDYKMREEEGKECERRDERRKR